MPNHEPRVNWKHVLTRSSSKNKNVLSTSSYIYKYNADDFLFQFCFLTVSLNSMDKNNHGNKDISYRIKHLWFTCTCTTVWFWIISCKKLNILFTCIIGLGAGLAQGLVETGSPRKALKYVNFKVLSGKNQFFLIL